MFATNYRIMHPENQTFQQSFAERERRPISYSNPTQRTPLNVLLGHPNGYHSRPHSIYHEAYQGNRRNNSINAELNPNPGGPRRRASSNSNRKPKPPKNALTKKNLALHNEVLKPLKGDFETSVKLWLKKSTTEEED